MNITKFKLTQEQAIATRLRQGEAVSIETGLGEIEIYPICIEGKGCQGVIRVRTHNGKVIRAELKSARIIWRLGDVLERNDVQDFIEWVNYVISLTSLIKPLLDKYLPTEYHMQPYWGVEITIFTAHCDLPTWADPKRPHETMAIKLDSLLRALRRF